MKTNVYEMVTNRIIEQLEKGMIPWQKPWSGSNKGAYNMISNKPYSLLNQMTLQHTGEYATFKQWTDLGGRIRKGEKAEQIVFWKIQPIEKENEDGEKVIRQIPILKYFNVFHISQVDGVEPKEDIKVNEHEPIEQAEKVKVDYMAREHLQIRETITLELSSSEICLNFLIQSTQTFKRSPVNSSIYPPIRPKFLPHILHVPICPSSLINIIEFIILFRKFSVNYFKIYSTKQIHII